MYIAYEAHFSFPPFHAIEMEGPAGTGDGERKRKREEEGEELSPSEQQLMKNDSQDEKTC